MTTTTQDTDERPPSAAQLLRMVDMRIPLPWLLTGFAAAVMVLAGMYSQLQKVTESLADLKIQVAAGNAQSSSVVSDLALLKFRLEALEAEARQRGVAPASPFRR